MKNRSWLLPFIVFLIVASLLGLLAISGWGIYSQQNAMVQAAEDFAKLVAQDLAGETTDSPQPGQFHRSELSPSAYTRRSRKKKMLESGPPVHGWLAIFDNEGRLIDGSGGSRELPEITEAVKTATVTKTMQTATIKIDRNPPSALAAVPCTDGNGVAVAVISHYLVPPNMKSVVNAMSYYGAATIAGISIAAFGVLLLWKYCIHPLRTLAGKISDLQWGRDIYVESHEPLPEIEGMQQALCDLSKRAVEQENLKNSYESATIRSREDERSVLADNIHDYPLQTVLSLVQRIQLASRAASRDVPNMERIKKHLSLAEESGQTAVSQLREACNKLSPPWLSLGAKRALEQISGSLSDLYKLSITTDVETGEKAPSKRHVREMCHIVQAAVENSAYHGDAQNVRISLQDDSSTFILKVSDDGKGLTEDPGLPQDPAVLHKRGLHGLAEMTERANSMDGTLLISNVPGGGAVLTVTMPCTLHDTLLKPSSSHWTLGADSDLKTLSIELSREHHANVTASVEGNDSGLSKRLLNEMCRTVRQAVANSVHHGHAENIRVKLSCEDDRYVLTVRDDGSGLQGSIDPEQLKAEGHRGIAGMTERTQMFGGTFELENDEDGGAIVTVTVPKS